MVVFRGKIELLQTLRFLAATMVVWLHAQSLADPISVSFVPSTLDQRSRAVGAAGVDIFFVISGAIMYLTALARGTNAIVFVRRRFLRIAPIYYLVTLAWFAIAPLVDVKTATTHSLLTTFTFWPAWGKLEVPALAAGWTLCFEMLFYAGVGAVLWRPRLVWVLAAVIAVAWIVRVLTQWSAVQFLGSPMILEFLFGVGLAAIWRRAKEGSPWWFGAVLALSGAALVFAGALPLPMVSPLSTLQGSVAVWRVIVWGVPSAMIVAGALALTPYLRGRWMAWPVFLGDASYAIYLTHYPVIAVLVRVLGRAPHGLLARPYEVALVIIAVAVGSATYRWIEGPIGSLFNRLPSAGFAARTSAAD